MSWRDYAQALLERELAADRDPAVLAAAETAVAAATDQLQAAIDTGSDDPFFAVAAAADLDTISVQVLALCAAVEVDRQLQRIVAALAHDPAATRIEVDLLVRLLGEEALAALTDDAPLACAALVEVESGISLAAAHVVLARAVAWAVLGAEVLETALPPDAYLVSAPEGALGRADVVLVHGTDRVRRIQAAVVAGWGIGFLVSPAPLDDAGWRTLVRQATVLGLGIVLDLTEPLSPLGRRWIARASHLTFGLCAADPLPLDALPDRSFVEVAAPGERVTDEEWAAVFADAPAPQRRPTATELRQAARVAELHTDPKDAIRRVASGTLLKHATRITPRVGWDELILPAAQRQRLHDLVSRYRFRTVVHDEWGLPLYPSPGVVTLFSGPSGTGKTTTAEVIAHELGVDMFRVDLSALVSKYIGETEKNLEEIFSAAHAGDYLLLFDEADSLFGTRSKVTDARDRYANMEVSYLLQRLETYDGFVVLTSNFQGNIDQAFLRRIHVTVHFAIPSVEDRQRIWERSLGDAPLDDLDLAFIADRFDLTGGSIRNAALTAAFYAASGGRKITMIDMLLAITQEMIKLGRRPNDDQYGRWLSEFKE